MACTSSRSKSDPAMNNLYPIMLMFLFYAIPSILANQARAMVNIPKLIKLTEWKCDHINDKKAYKSYFAFL